MNEDRSSYFPFPKGDYFSLTKDTFSAEKTIVFVPFIISKVALFCSFFLPLFLLYGFKQKKEAYLCLLFYLSTIL
ncbi:hypothetical protein EFE32_12735 [Lactococcus lactis subsp. lactis]|nr:hypothetical protein [Lactococcus lactis subsp. lactis]